MSTIEDPPVCARCGEEYLMTEPDQEPTRYCNECAHVVVAELESGFRAGSATESDRRRYATTTALYVVGHSNYDREGDEWVDVPERNPPVVAPEGDGWRMVGMSSIRVSGWSYRLFFAWEAEQQ